MRTQSDIALRIGSSPIGELLRFQDVEVGTHVADNEDPLLIGTVRSIHDIHNVDVEYQNGGAGLYCMDPGCPDFDPLLAHINRVKK